MNEIVDTEYELRWQPPIRVRVGTGIADTVRAPEEALEYLNARSPKIWRTSKVSGQSSYTTPWTRWSSVPSR
jgi:hypothetical protein